MLFELCRLIPLVPILLVFTKDFVATTTKIKLKQLKFEPHQFCDYWPVAMAMLVNSKLQSICPLIQQIIFLNMFHLYFGNNKNGTLVTAHFCSLP